ncbi:E3 ubiquitin-protein ligase ATL42-like [Euphorbia lathyris]|uniref:E3 ubiquitin-protein ligase ATL42-like n=1 Tax=Euphorbia lathyris TaxID=212925 RepID=UPI003313A3D5
MDGPSQDAVSSFQPSLAVVIGVLCIMFFFTFILLVYAKFCHRRGSDGDSPNNFVLVRSGSRYSGIDETVIQSLPFFRFSSLKGSKEGLECAVCLSKFEDIEVLRLLPKCKHAFHINCVDKWLEKHSSCPLCRSKVSADDPAIFTNSNSMRFLANQSDSNLELFIQREESRPSSSRFSSFRKLEKATTDEKALMEEEKEQDDDVFDKYNHRIIVSDVVFNDRWSSVSSSDLMFLSSELLNDVTSSRFICSSSSSEQIVKIKEEMEMKRLFGARNSCPSTSDSEAVSGGNGSSIVNSGERRSVSEITGFSRFGNLGTVSKNTKQERLRSLWFANRERRTRPDHNTRHTLNV